MENGNRISSGAARTVLRTAAVNSLLQGLGFLSFLSACILASVAVTFILRGWILDVLSGCTLAIISLLLFVLSSRLNKKCILRSQQVSEENADAIRSNFGITRERKTVWTLLASWVLMLIGIVCIWRGFWGLVSFFGIGLDETATRAYWNVFSGGSRIVVGLLFIRFGLGCFRMPSEKNLSRISAALAAFCGYNLIYLELWSVHTVFGGYWVAGLSGALIYFLLVWFFCSAEGIARQDTRNGRTPAWLIGFSLAELCAFKLVQNVDPAILAAIRVAALAFAVAIYAGVIKLRGSQLMRRGELHEIHLAAITYGLWLATHSFGAHLERMLVSWPAQYHFAAFVPAYLHYLGVGWLRENPALKSVDSEIDQFKAIREHRPSSLEKPAGWVGLEAVIPPGKWVSDCEQLRNDGQAYFR